MMIESFNTGVAILAMRCAWRSVDVASATKFDFKTMSLDWHAVNFFNILYLVCFITIVDRDII